MFIPLLTGYAVKYSFFIGSLEISDRAESGIIRTFDFFFGEVMTERKNRILRIQYMAT